jgi:perosamine synthetase
LEFFVIQLFKQILSEEMKQAAISALENERFVGGESIARFEEAFAKYCSVKRAVAVSSGTAALHLALLASGIEKQKMLTTAFSFIATPNSIIHSGNTPEFCDAEQSTALIDAEKLPRKTKAKAILPVHLFGQPADMKALCDYAAEREIFLLEDACQAHGAEFKGKKVGGFGDAAAFSFYPSKNMTVCGDGGMVTTDNEELAQKLRILRDCGRKTKYEHDVIGFTNRLNTVNAAIGLVQLKHLDEWNEKRRKAAGIYRKSLPPEVLLEEKSGRKSVYNLFVIKVSNRKMLEAKLEKENIGFGVHYPIPLHLQPIYRKMFGFKQGMMPVSERLSEEAISLPMHPNISAEEIRQVCDAVNCFLKRPF